MIGFHYRTQWTESIEAFDAGPLVVGLLQVACGDVIESSVSGNVIPEIVRRPKMKTALTNDQRELAFIMNALRSTRQNDGFPDSDDR